MGRGLGPRLWGLEFWQLFPGLALGAVLPRRERLLCLLRDPCGSGVWSVLSVRGQAAVGDLDLLGNLTLPLNRN